MKKQSKQNEVKQKTTWQKAPEDELVSKNIVDADVQFKMGNDYYYGNGVKKDYKKAFYWYRKAAVQGHAAAQCELGYCYQYGKGTVKNYQSAVYWYKRSASQDYGDGSGV